MYMYMYMYMYMIYLPMQTYVSFTCNKCMPVFELEHKYKILNLNDAYTGASGI